MMEHNLNDLHTVLLDFFQLFAHLLELPPTLCLTFLEPCAIELHSILFSVVVDEAANRSAPIGELFGLMLEKPFELPIEFGKLLKIEDLLGLRSLGPHDKSPHR